MNRDLRILSLPLQELWLAVCLSDGQQELLLTFMLVGFRFSILGGNRLLAFIFEVTLGPVRSLSLGTYQLIMLFTDEGETSGSSKLYRVKSRTSDV